MLTKWSAHTTTWFRIRPFPTQRVIFGTSGHRGSSLKTSFNEAHIVAISQAIAEYRKAAGVDGPLYIGRDTHALTAGMEEPRSRCSWRTA